MLFVSYLTKGWNMFHLFQKHQRISRQNSADAPYNKPHLNKKEIKRYLNDHDRTFFFSAVLLNHNFYLHIILFFSRCSTSSDLTTIGEPERSCKANGPHEGKNSIIWWSAFSGLHIVSWKQRRSLCASSKSGFPFVCLHLHSTGVTSSQGVAQCGFRAHTTIK